MFTENRKYISIDNELENKINQMKILYRKCQHCGRVFNLLLLQFPDNLANNKFRKVKLIMRRFADTVQFEFLL